ncbi:MATE family efflux transporter [Gallintestinimicrobium sp.]|uniref:MATE family efflux transporter n=1 Tax=Gallintestinimicrobium sp. TaxID=2981655 RepID=UPI00399A758F
MRFADIALGLSTFVMQSSESVISVCFNSSLLKYGGDLAVGAMTILTSTMQFAMLPLQGIGQGAQPIMSYNYGARNIDRMKKTFKLHLVISLIYSTLFWLFVQLFPEQPAGIFQRRSRRSSPSPPAVRSADLLRCDVPLRNPARLAR